MREPLNLKLLAAYLIRRIWICILIVLVFALLFGGGYYLDNYVFAPAPDYVATSELYLTYADDVRLENIYVNDYTWQILADSDACVEEALDLLPFEADAEYLRNAVTAGLESDVRLVILKVTDKDPAKAVTIAKAYEIAIRKLGEKMRDIEEVQIFTSPDEAVKREWDNRTLRMSITGAVAGLCVAITVLLFAFSLDDSVTIPETVKNRYGIPVLACFAKDGKPVSDWSRAAAKENLAVVTEGKSGIGLTDVSGRGGYTKETMTPILNSLEESLGKNSFFLAADAVGEDPSVAGILRKSDGVIVLIKAGVQNGKKTEQALRFLEVQQIPVLGAVLYNTDRAGLLRYLGERKQ